MEEDDDDDGRQLQDARIIDGKEADPFAKPYMAFIGRYTNYDTMILCGGVFIAPSIILTAAHCVNEGPDLVSIGRHDLTNPSENPLHYENYEKFRVIYSTLYNPYQHSYDYGLIFLDGSPVSNVVKVNRNLDLTPYEGQSMKVLGWGRTERGYVNVQYLKEALLTYQTSSVCSANYAPWTRYIHPTVLCGMYETGNICLGDSGGPLLLEGDDSSDDLLIGITSFVFPNWKGDKACDPRAPTGYANVAQAMPWIDSNVCFFSRHDELLFSPNQFPCTSLPTLTMVLQGSGRMRAELFVREKDSGSLQTLIRLKEEAIFTLGTSMYTKTFYLYPTSPQQYLLDFNFRESREGGTLRTMQLWLGPVGSGTLLHQAKSVYEAIQQNPFVMDIDESLLLIGRPATLNTQENQDKDSSVDSSSLIDAETIIANLFPPFTSTPTPPSNGPYLQVDITFDQHPEEVSWTFTEVNVGSRSYTVIKQEEAGKYTDQSSVTLYLPFELREGGTAILFTLTDSQQNGICCEDGEGRYEITYIDENNIKETTISQDGIFGQHETTGFFIIHGTVQTHTSRLSSSATASSTSTMLFPNNNTLQQPFDDNTTTTTDDGSPISNDEEESSDYNDQSTQISNDEPSYDDVLTPSPTITTISNDEEEERRSNNNENKRRRTRIITYVILSIFLLGWFAFFILLHKTNNI